MSTTRPLYEVEVSNLPDRHSLFEKHHPFEGRKREVVWENCIVDEGLSVGMESPPEPVGLKMVKGECPDIAVVVEASGETDRSRSHSRHPEFESRGNVSPRFDGNPEVPSRCSSDVSRPFCYADDRSDEFDLSDKARA